MAAPSRRDWEKAADEAFRRQPPRAKRFLTTSSVEVPPLASAEDLAGWDQDRDLGVPGAYPFTRGVHPTMYRGRLWTMRLFSGFGTPEETNARFHYLLEHGQTGLSTAFDMPTLYGYDATSEHAIGEVGKCGVSVSSLEDMELLFKGIPLGDVSTSMTINAPAAIIWAMYLAVAEKQGVDWSRLRGTLQNDMLKEFIAQKEWIMGPRPHLDLVTDTVEFAVRNVPKWNIISISGYHIREAGSTAVQELAYTLADGFTYVEEAVRRGLSPDEFLPQYSFFFNSHNDLFEEVAKFRAARRIWARLMKEKYGAREPRSWMLRFHTQTAGCSLTLQQPLNNIIRTTIQGLAAVLGGTQSLHTNSYDEAWALPTEQAARIALRTQQILAHESGAANTIDPVGGSYFVEWMTDKMEADVNAIFDEVGRMGGVLQGIERGYFQREIAEAAARYQREIDEGERIIVGVNEYTAGNEADPIEILRIDEDAVRKRQQERLSRLKARRSRGDVETALEAVTTAVRKHENQMPALLQAVKAYATLEEICDVWRHEFGEWRESPTL